MKDVLNNKFTDQVRFTHEHLTPQITEYLAIHEYEIKDNAKKIIDLPSNIIFTMLLKN